MKTLVTGAAGFIGSTLVDHLLADGHEVVGVDGFTTYYEEAAKRSNLADAWDHAGFQLVEADLRTLDLEPLVAEAELVFHLAAQPGVRRSWQEFEVYVHDNILVTHRLLEAVRTAPGVRRMVYASSSSVYGNAASYPTSEADPARPHSPYGVTKLAAEDLCSSYAANFGVPTASLRYFTVYGPRQRPDMAFHRMCEAVLDGTSFPLYGDGTARRNFTYVDDVATATRLAGVVEDVPLGAVINVAGDDDVDMTETMAILGELAGTPLEVERLGDQAGDVRRTGGRTDRARELLGWSATVGIADGLAAQLAWHKARR